MHQHLHRPRKASAALLSTFYFLSNAVFLHAGESNFWVERRKRLQNASSDSASVLMAGLPAAASGSSAADFLRQFPTLDRHALTPALSESVAKDLPEGFAKKNAGLLTSLPYAYGSVHKISLPAGSIPQRIVIHIQDVHQNQEAQSNIGQAVQTLVDKGQVGLVALEGAFEPIDLSGLRSFSRQDVLHKLADYLLRANKVSGPIHAALTGAKAFPPIEGIDDPDHYWANVKAYQRSSPIIKEYKDKIAVARDDLERRKAAIFNQELLGFDRKVRSYEDGKTGLADHVQNLASHAPAGAMTPALRDFLQALAMESALDFKQVEKERGELVERLVQKLDKDHINTLLQWSAAYRAGQIRYANFYKSLRDLCGRNGVSLSSFPAMDAYVRYVLSADRIDAERLMGDMSALEKTAYAHLAKTPEEKGLVRESRGLTLTGKLVDFSLTPDEYREYGEFSSPLGKGKGEGLSLSSFEAFYKEAHARDQAMTDNLLKAMEKDKANTAVLVTGGYHSPGITERLLRAGVTVVSFTPKIEKIDATQGSAYLSVFTQEKTPLEKLFQGQKLFLSPEPTEGLRSAPASLPAGVVATDVNRGRAEKAPADWTASELAADARKAFQELARIGHLPADLDESGVQVSAQGDRLQVAMTLRQNGDSRRVRYSFDRNGAYLDVVSMEVLDLQGRVAEIWGKDVLDPMMKAASLWIDIEESRVIKGHPVRLFLYRVFGVQATEPLWLPFYLMASGASTLTGPLSWALPPVAILFTAFLFAKAHPRERFWAAFWVGIGMGAVYFVPGMGLDALGPLSIFSSMAVHGIYNAVATIFGLQPASLWTLDRPGSIQAIKPAPMLEGVPKSEMARAVLAAMPPVLKEGKTVYSLQDALGIALTEQAADLNMVAAAVLRTVTQDQLADIRAHGSSSLVLEMSGLDTKTDVFLPITPEMSRTPEELAEEDRAAARLHPGARIHFLSADGKAPRDFAHPVEAAPGLFRGNELELGVVNAAVPAGAASVVVYEPKNYHASDPAALPEESLLRRPGAVAPESLLLLMFERFNELVRLIDEQA